MLMFTKRLFIPTLVVLLRFAAGQTAWGQCGSGNWSIKVGCGTNIQAFAGFAPGSPILFCEGEVVTVINKSTPSNEITKTYIDWGDGTPCETYDGFQTAMTHAYDFPNDTCVAVSSEGTITFQVRLGVEKSCGPNTVSFHFSQFPVAVQFKPVAIFSILLNPQCVNEPVSFNNTSCSNDTDPNVSYLWDFGDGTTSTAKDPGTKTYSTPGTYTARLRVTNRCGTSETTRVVVIRPLATAMATASLTTVCVGGTVSFTNQSTNALRYKWTVTPAADVTFVAPTSDTSTAPQIRFNNVGTYTVRLRALGCGNPEWTVIINVQAPPTLTLNSIPPPCYSGSPVTVNPSVNQLGGTSPTVTWSFPGGTPATGQGNTPGPVTYPAPGTYTITATAANGCASVTQTLTVPVQPPATADFSLSAVNLCSPDDTLFITNNSLNAPANSHTWTITPNSGFTFVNGTNASSKEPVIHFTEANTYTIRLSVNACGTPVLEKTVTVKAKPTLNFPALSDTCLQTITLNPAALVSIGGSPASSIQWSFLNGTPASGSGPNPPPVTFAGPGNFGITVQVTNECGSVEQTRAFDIRPVATAAATTNRDTLCGPDELLEITNLSTNAFTNNPFAWTIQPSTGFAFINGTDASSKDPVIRFDAEGEYTLTLQVNGCGNPVWTKKIRVFLAVNIAVTPIADGCKDLVINPLDWVKISGGTPNQINWTFTGGTPASATGATPGPVSFIGPGSYAIIVSANTRCNEDTQKIAFSILAPVEVSILGPGDTTVCSGTGPIPLVASDSVGQWIGQQIVQGPRGPVFDPALPGIYTLIFERGIAECRRADTIAVTVIDAAAVNAGPDLYACNTQSSITLSGAQPAQGIFSGPALNGNTVDITQLQAGNAYEYLYTVSTLPAACNNDKRLLYIEAPPSAGFGLSQDTVCVGQTLTVIPVATGNVQFSVNWGDGTVNSMLSHTYSQPGNYPIQLRAFTLNPLTGGLLCEAESALSVRVIEPLKPDSVRFTGAPTEGCGPLSVRFTNQSAVERGRFTWIFGNGDTYVGFAPGPVVFQPGVEDTTYVVRLLVDNGCETFEVQQPITVFPLPRANFGISYPDPCSGAILEANVLSVGNPEQNTFFTSTGLQAPGLFTQTTRFQFFTDSVPQTVGIYLVTSNFCGSDTAYQEVVVNPTDVVALIGFVDTTDVCVGSPVTAVNFSTNGAPVSWSVSNGNTYLGNAVNLVFDQAGAYTVTLYAFGCGFDSVTAPIYVHPLPTVSLAHELRRCPGDPVNFSVDTDAPGIILWYGNGDSTLLKTSSAVYTQPGAYAPRVQAVSERGCVAELVSALTILTPPAAQIAADDSLCVGAPAQFTALGNTGAASCLWNFGDGNLSDRCQTQHRYAAPGQYSAVLTVVSQEGCRAADTVAIYVRHRPNADFTYVIEEPCSPGRVAFQSTTTGATGLVWSFGDGQGSTVGAPQHVYPTSGNYKVTLIASNEGICFDTMRKSLRIFQTPILDLDLDVQCTIAEGTHLTVSTIPKQTFVQIKGPNGFEATGNLHLNRPAGTYQIAVVSIEGCRTDTSVFVLPPNEIFLDLQEDTFFISLGTTVRFDARVNRSDLDIAWTPRLYFLDPNDVFNLHPELLPLRTIRYTITASDSTGCSKTDSVWVFVKIERDSGLFIPSGFTPNEDNVNDIFYIRSSNPGIKRLAVFQIFDKYGEKVFDIRDLPGGDEAHPENPYFGWDGTFRGQKAEMGSYRYVAVLEYVDDHKETKTGTIQLLR